MRIAIMGAGAMGCMFGAKYARSGNEVCLIDGWRDHVEKIKADGLNVERDGETYNVKLDIVYKAEDAVQQLQGPAELVMIFCKGMQTEETIQKAAPLIGPETCVLTLQNGIGNPEIIGKYVAHDRVFFGAASAGSVILGPGSIRDTTQNRPMLIHIMPLDRKINDKCKEVAAVISKAGMGTDATLYAEKYVWEKLSLNCCVNAVSVLTHMCLKDMNSDRNGFMLFNRIVAEVAAVAKAKGVDETYESLRSFVHLAAYKSSHYPSMLQDAHNKRPLELDTITGAIVREGKKYGIPTPVNEAILLLTSMISNNYANLWY